MGEESLIKVVGTVGTAGHDPTLSLRWPYLFEEVGTAGSPVFIGLYYTVPTVPTFL